MKQWRTGLFLCVVAVLAAIIIGRLFYLQVINRKFYQSLALGQQAGFRKIVGKRGEVFLQNSKDSQGSAGSEQKRSLAINNANAFIWVNPSKVEDKEAFADSLANVLGEPAKNIAAKLAQESTYVVIKENVLEVTITEVKKLKLAGLYIESAYQRFYPQENLASQVIGFVGGDNIGQYGIEGYYEEQLKGKTGIKEEKRGLGIIDILTDESYLNGSDLYLTIDYNIQFQAEALLSQAKQDIDIDSGQIIVVKPVSGRVVALANFPSFNPNKYGKEEGYGIFQNSAVQKIFEPGSVFKPFTMAMALQEQKITPETTFLDEGFVKIGKDTVHNFDRKKYGSQTMSGILEKSINTGAVFLAQKLSHQTFLDYLEKLGFTQKTGIDVQGEVFSHNSALSDSDFNFATAAFGQGIEMTPMQLVRAFSVLANGGKMAKPNVVEKISHGSKEQINQPKISDQIISEKTATEVTKMLINVIEQGFGSAAKVKRYYLAGKTGTAEVPIEGRKGYYTDRTIQSFIGYGPALKPEFLMLVKLDNPKVPKSSLSAAPIFKKLAQYIINYWQIPPDY